MATKATTKKTDTTNGERVRTAEEIVRASQSDPTRPVKRADMDGKIATTELEDDTVRGKLKPQEDTKVNEVSGAIIRDEEKSDKSDK